MIIGYKLGSIGSDLIYPLRSSSYFHENLEFIRMTGNVGSVYVHPNSNLRNPSLIWKLIEPSNVVVNLCGPNYNYHRWEQFEEVNIQLPKKIAKAAREQGVKKMIHFSSLGVDSNSKSMDLKSKFIGEQEILNQFPDATILRIAPFVSIMDNLTTNFTRETEFWSSLIPVYSDLQSKK